MKNLILILILISSLQNKIFSQTWNLKLRSTVDLRTWKLTTKSQEIQEPLPGAKIILYKGNTIVNQIVSDADGAFVIDVPPNGDYILEVSYPECNTKRFSVSTFNVPDNIFNEKYNPSFGIGGFVMAKPFQGIDYSGLKQPLVFVRYEPKLKNFNKDDVVTDNGINIVTNIAEKENELIQKFCNYNKQGNEALEKPDCPLAKSLYNKAIETISNENYPKEQLLKTDICFKKLEDDAKKNAEALKEKSKKDSLDKISQSQKLIDAQKNKLAKDSLDKVNKEKEAANKLAKEQDAIKKAKEKAEKDKIAKEKLAKDKATKETQTSAKQNTVATKATKPVENTKLENTKPTTTNSESNQSSQTKGDSKYKVPQVLGANPYKDNITKANDYLKQKRYAEAKKAYEEALKVKPGDAFATSKLAECEAILSKTK